LLDVPDVALDDVLIVEDPLSDGGRPLFQESCLGEIRANQVDPLSSLPQSLEEPGVPLRLRVHLAIHGQTPGMLLDLCRGKRHPKTPYVFDQTGALRIQDRDHGRYLTAFPKHGHRGPHEIDGRLENQDGLLGRQPARMIREESSLDSELRSPHPHPTEKGSQRCGRQDRRTRPRPVENQESNSGESAEQDGREGHGKSAAPKEGVQGVDTSACGLVDQCGAAEAPPSQLPEGSPSFFTSYEVSCENTCLHCMQYSLLFRQWPPSGMNDALRQPLVDRGRSISGGTWRTAPALKTHPRPST